jgi:hypothetical protein
MIFQMQNVVQLLNGRSEMKIIRTKLAMLALTALAGCASFKEPHEVTVMRWCDGGRNAVLMAVNERHMGQHAMIKQDWSHDGYTYMAAEKPIPPQRYWNWDDDPIGEQWAATQWVYNLPPEKFIQVDARTIETEYVQYCNRVNN